MNSFKLPVEEFRYVFTGFNTSDFRIDLSRISHCN